MTYVTCVPAYGRDYKSAKEVKKALEAGKDFRICDMFHPRDGSYLNKDDAKGLILNIRYAKLTKVCVIKV